MSRRKRNCLNVPHSSGVQDRSVKISPKDVFLPFVIALQKYASLISARQKIKFSLLQIFTIFLIPIRVKLSSN